MKLRQFQVTNFRSVNDSGWIEVGKRTALVGRNESGKSNILLGLQTLNPPGGRKELSLTKDFPRDRSKTEYSDKLTVVESLWDLDEDDQADIAAIFPRADKVTEVTVSRDYAGTVYIRFQNLPGLAVPDGELPGILDIIGAEASKNNLGQSFQALRNAVDVRRDRPAEWATSIAAAVKALKESATAESFAFSNDASAAISRLEKIAQTIASDSDAHGKARTWVVKNLPVFVYVPDYDEVPGHQNVAEFIQRDESKTRNDRDDNFAKLCKVAELEPAELHAQINGDHEVRQQLTNRAGALVTRQIRELWTDRKLKVRFHLDGKHFDTLISDESNVYDVEINLSERSRGFQWFFSFYVVFTADTLGGDKESAILLLDEPGLFLHALAQKDLLRFFEDRMPNQVVYTTHSPFMIPSNDISAVRTVSIDQKFGTVVTNDPAGDTKTLFPLQSALGYEVAQSLFVGEYNLVVEGITDYWYLTVFSEALKDAGRTHLPDVVTVTPAGGAQKVHYLVVLLASNQLKVVILLDDERASRQTAEDLVKQKLLADDHVVFASEGLAAEAEADIEDLIDPTVYEALVLEAYAKDLKGKTLKLNDKFPRRVQRYEKAFKELGMEFNKTRPAKLLLRKAAEKPADVFTEDSFQGFERLFIRIKGLFKVIRDKNVDPFA